ncbi:cytochrome [Sesamum angolense]|uniref:Cytochrome n=1 Tax=Sesamum angolense TaxID=2727404 RepID=A0AAE2BJR7_9LAMI|nr:cytochrome [Sesamum angolense]
MTDGARSEGINIAALEYAHAVAHVRVAGQVEILHQNGVGTIFRDLELDNGGEILHYPRLLAAREPNCQGIQGFGGDLPCIVSSILVKRHTWQTRCIPRRDGCAWTLDQSSLLGRASGPNQGYLGLLPPPLAIKPFGLLSHLHVPFPQEQKGSKSPCPPWPSGAAFDWKPAPVCHSHQSSYSSMGTFQETWLPHAHEARPCPRDEKSLVLHLFSLKKAQSFRPFREDEISRMVAKIQAVASSSDRVVVDLSEIVTDLATTLICRIAFGTRYDEQGSERRRFKELVLDAQAAMANFYVSDYYSLFSWVDKLTGKLAHLDASWKSLDLFYQELIEDHLHRNRPKTTEEEEEEDILDVLIRLKEQNVLSSDLTWDHVKAMLMDIFIAGRDTSIASTIWTMTALMKAPVVMKKVNRNKRIVPLLRRETMENCILEGYKIQPKSMVYVNAWAIARDPEYWEDPHTFFPDRFLNSDVDIKGHHFGVLPFGSGRRICPGMFMGLANVELTVANLVCCFDWEVQSGIQDKILIPMHCPE